jgi:ribonuclease E
MSDDIPRKREKASDITEVARPPIRGRPQRRRGSPKPVDEIPITTDGAAPAEEIAEVARPPIKGRPRRRRASPPKPLSDTTTPTDEAPTEEIAEVAPPSTKSRPRRRRASPPKPAADTTTTTNGAPAEDVAEVARPSVSRPRRRRTSGPKPVDDTTTSTDGGQRAQVSVPTERIVADDVEPAPETINGSGNGNGRRRRKPRRRPTRQTRPAIERTMLVHADPRGTRVGVIENDEIVEHYVTRLDDRSLAGNVYLGRVQNVLPGMEASFIDIGEARNGVLYAGEVGIAGDEDDEIPRIETVLKSGQPILVQVTKDPMRAKGARLTALVSIAGRHLVLVPNAGSIGVSRRLLDRERTRLRDLAAEVKPDGHGLIVRTAAEGASRADIERDLKRLVATWDEISDKAAKAEAPALVYEEPQLELRIIRDLFNREIARCVVDDRGLEELLRDYVRQTTPDLDHRLELYEGELPIFEEFRVAEQIRKSLDRRVWLPSGGHIVIDRTEAMTVIDVNTGKFVGKKTLEETVFRTNKEAAVEVGRQLRLRDIGGIIVIDFIDMEMLENREEIIKTFRRELERDRTRTQVFDISPLGLVQMTRKNVSTGIVEAFSDPCPTCEGRGILIHDLD